MGTEQADVVVVGGGLAGLVAAARAAGGGRRVVLLEGHGLGGRARSEVRQGFTFNRGPHALYRGGAAERVLTELGVRLSGATPPVDGGRALAGGQHHLLPQGPTSVLRTSLLGLREVPSFGRAFLKLTTGDPGRFTGRSVREVVDDLKLRGRTAELVEALVRLTTYVNAPEAMDAGAAIANLRAGLAGVRYLDGGWQTMVDGLTGALADRGVDVRPHAAVRSVTSDGDRVVVAATDGDVAARTTVLATGTPDAAASLLGTRPEGWDRLGPPVTAACLDLGLRRPPADRFVLGVDEPLYLSLHCPPAGLAPDGQAVVHVMRYQPADDDQPADQQRARLRDLATGAGVAADEVVEERFLARLTVSGGFPTAAAGGLAGRPTVEVPGHPGVLVAGDWVGPEGLLADAAVASGDAAGRLAARRSAGTGIGVAVA